MRIQIIFIYNNEYWFSDNNFIYLYNDDDGLTTFDVKYNILSISKNNDDYIIGTDNGITFFK